jgi:hypothetical protein
MDPERVRTGRDSSPELANVVERNIQALVAHRKPLFCLHPI